MNELRDTGKNAMIYLDYNATAPLRIEVAETMMRAFSMIGNPSSIHRFGRNIRREIESAREQVALLINADPIDIVFTSGATEANNAVITGAPVTRVLYSAIEHPSVTEVARASDKAAVIPVLPSGVIDTHVLEQLLTETKGQALVSVMWVNNETGVIQPMDEIVRLAKEHGALVHCDAVQALGKIPIDMRHSGIDYLTLSAHKIGGPTGIGALVYSHHARLAAHQLGGGQERRRRAGTENFTGIMGFGKVCECARMDMGHWEQIRIWRDRCEIKMKNAVSHVEFAGSDAPRAGNVIQAILPNVPAETQLMALDLAGIAVSSGSACSSGSVKPSHVLLAMGVAAEKARCAIRVSMGHHTVENDVNEFLTQWVTISQRLSQV